MKIYPFFLQDYAIANEETKAVYKASAEEDETAYNVAVADFLNVPHINEIDMSHYTGQPDSYSGSYRR